MKCIIPILFVASSQALPAQCDSLLQAINSDSGQFVIMAYGEGQLDTISAEFMAPYFQFSYLADSSAMTWTFTEIFSNRRKLYLSNWCHNRIINWDDGNEVPIEDWSESDFRARSTTRVFPIMGGDTIQFYRTIWWVDRLNPNTTSFSRYVNSNPLSYSIELIDMADSKRIILLDTFFINSTTTSKKPCIFSWHPMLSRVRAIIPQAVDSTHAFIRINVWATGANTIPFTRKDGQRKMLSSYHLGSTAWTYYNDSVEVNIDCVSQPTCDLTVSTSSSPSGINVSHAWPSNADIVRVSNIFGSVVWSSLLPLGSNPTFYPLNPGLYIVCSISQGQVVCTRKLIVQ